jgi:hypothetical protein
MFPQLPLKMEEFQRIGGILKKKEAVGTIRKAAKNKIYLYAVAGL